MKDSVSIAPRHILKHTKPGKHLDVSAGSDKICHSVLIYFFLKSFALLRISGLYFLTIILTFSLKSMGK